MKSNFDMCELFKMWEDGNKFSAMELVSDCFWYNELEFNINDARGFVNDVIEEFIEMRFACNQIVFMCERLGRDWLRVYSMDELNDVMDGWCATRVCEYCCHDKFSELDNYFYFDYVYNIAYSAECLIDTFDEYNDLENFIDHYMDTFRDFLYDWDDEYIEIIERNEYMQNEIGNVYMY